LSTACVRERGLDGVVCGHIQSAAIKQVENLLYVNCCDWVDSCTAIIEHMDGRLELIHWRHRTTTEVADERSYAAEFAQLGGLHPSVANRTAA
jgi:hypothetical protein